MTSSDSAQHGDIWDMGPCLVFAVLHRSFIYAGKQAAHDSQEPGCLPAWPPSSGGRMLVVRFSSDLTTAPSSAGEPYPLDPSSSDLCFSSF